jgi:isochorismate synthase EntC
MQWENDRVALFVGCGINKGSNPELEFLETVNKAATVKRAL